MEYGILKDIIIITGLTIPVTLLCHRFRIPSIIGFILTGTVIGPYGLKSIHTPDHIDAFAEFGVIALLFTIGLEFSLRKLWSNKKNFIYGGALQVLMTGIISAAAALAFSQSPSQAVLIGCMVSLSSTALVLSLLQEKAQIESPHGRATLAILIFQDIAVVAMILLVPLLAGKGMGVSAPHMAFLVLGKIILLAIIVIGGERWVVPRILYRVVRTGNRELFILSVLFICLAIAFITSSLGLSLALGAFIAGLMIAESDYSHRALGSILPLKDIFTSFFFVSIGMLFDPGLLLRSPVTLLAAAVLVIVIKTAAGALSMLFLRRSLRTSLLTGSSLSQIGEFSFIICQTAVLQGIFSEDFMNFFLGVSLITIFLTPSVMTLAPVFSDMMKKLHVPFSGNGIPEIENGRKSSPERDHLIIIGYGLVGRNIARAAKAGDIPFTIIEMNIDTVIEEQGKGEPIFYGDATQEGILNHASIKEARVVVVAISDPMATRRVTEMARTMNPSAYIITRTRFMTDVEELIRIGANCVIPEEFETSIEIFTRVMKYYLLPQETIADLIMEIRKDGYRMLRSLSHGYSAAIQQSFRHHDIVITQFLIRKGSPLAGYALGETDLRKAYSISVIAIQREDGDILNPGGEAGIEAGDVITVMGARGDVIKFCAAYSFKMDA
ncbi:MAG: cation:proton antiporter [Vulcanimicrobiota bacterium]